MSTRDVLECISWYILEYNDAHTKKLKNKLLIIDTYTP